MSFKKSFHAVPIKLGPHYAAKRRRRDRKAIIRLFAAAVLSGLVAGAISIVVL